MVGSQKAHRTDAQQDKNDEIECLMVRKPNPVNRRANGGYFAITLRANGGYFAITLRANGSLSQCGGLLLSDA
jgi:hypothetical protein